jgi:hypothetical protein
LGARALPADEESVLNLLLMLIASTLPMALFIGSIVLAVRHGPFRNRWWRGETLLGFALVVGGLCFVAGFFGPMVFAPDANQGPMLGIFITGPAGMLLGLVWGGLRAVQRRRAA